MPLIYRHTCNMVDKTHRNFAFAQPFSIYLTSSLFFSLLSSECVLRCHHPNTIPHRSAKIATNTRKWRKELSRQRREEKKTHTQPTTTMTHGFENAKSMCPLCLYAIQLYGNEQINKQKTLPEHTHTSTHTKTFKSGGKKREKTMNDKKKSKSWEMRVEKRKRYLFHFVYLANVLVSSYFVSLLPFRIFSLVILTHTE